MYEEPEEFIKKTMLSAFYMTTGFVMFLAAVLSKSQRFKEIMIISFPIIFVLMFFYFLKLPDVRILKRQREISKSIVFAGRFLIIELESGVPIYDALTNVSRNFKDIGKYFDEIIGQVDMGTTLEEALNREIELTPSNNFRKLLWQILNSLKTGADISSSLNAVVEQIVREQSIESKNYGRKLNPFAMFYMILAVIMPTLGTTMLIVFSTFVSVTIGLVALLSLAGFFAFIQLMFLAVIKSQRPSYEM